MEEEIYVGDDFPTKEEELKISKYQILEPVMNKWEWDMFGTGGLKFALPFEVNWWQRLWMKILFHSKWKRIGE